MTSSELAPAVQLSDEERNRLAELEAEIEENLPAGLKLGLAIAEIKDRRLYRETHDLWEEYVRDRFDIARRTAFQYVASAHAYRLVHSCALTKPANESQLRPLLKLSDDAIPDAWAKAVETAPNGKVTGKHVSTVVSELLGEQIRNKAAGQQKATRSSAVLPDGLKDLIWQLIEQVRDARLKNTSKRVRDDLKKRIEGILNLLDD